MKTCESGELDDPGDQEILVHLVKKVNLTKKGEAGGTRALSSLPHARPTCNKSYRDTVI